MRSRLGTIMTTIGALLTLSVNSCLYYAAGPHDYDPDTTNNGQDTTTVITQPIQTRSSISFFPFDNPTTWWEYTEAGGNRLSIAVTDTISDDGTIYYRVSFMEQRVDTTDDWFKRSSSEGVLFCEALIGTYRQFMPPKLATKSGTFTSSAGSVDYTFYSTFRSGGVDFSNVYIFHYYTPFIHSFDEIAVADSIGIIYLRDSGGRWDIEYALDSCSISGNSRSMK